MSLTLAPHPKLTRHWWALALRGVTAILLGVLLIATPGLVLLTLALWIGAFMAVDGAFAIMAGARALSHHRHGAAALLAEGVLGAMLGVLLASSPAAGVATLVFLAAAWALLTGAALLWAAIALPLGRLRWLMGAAALLSLLLGALLVAHPVASALVLATWFGAYALVSGFLLLILAFGMRRRA